MTYAIVVTYNGTKWVDKCLGSLLHQETISRIIVVDNNSDDQTVAYIQENYPSVHLIANQQNYGFGHANNQAIQLAIKENAEYVFLLNQDAYIKDCAVDKMVHIHKSCPKYGILSPIHLQGDGSEIDMKYGIFVAQSENHQLISDLILHREQMKEVYSVNFVNAAAWLISRACLELVGGFAPIYSHYGEDVNYAHRVLFHHFKIGICPAAYIYHDRINSVEMPGIYDSRNYLEAAQVWDLIYLTNINYSYTKRFTKLIGIAIGRCSKYLLRFQIKKAVTSLKEVQPLIFSFRKILLNNRKTKKKGHTFLSIEK